MYCPFIGLVPSEWPIHTAEDNCGVKPTNQALSISSVVPVFPAACLPARA